MAVSTIDPNGLNVGQLGGFKNRIINGAMVFDQRRSGAAYTPSGVAYALDRWNTYMPTGSGHSIQRVTDAPAGFSYSQKITIGTGASPAASAQNAIWQAIEGNNVYDLSFGTASAKTITVSFVVKSSVTGTFNIALVNKTGTRAYVGTYTINSANTWETKAITVEGDTTGSWSTDNTIGLTLWFSLGFGSDYETTPNTWVSGDLKSASSTVDLVATSGATWQITGVQLEVGDVATPFEHEDYGTTLQKCQRYYWRQTRTNNGNTINAYIGIGQGVGTTEVVSFVRHPVQMRDSPTFSASGSSHIAAHGSSNLTQTGYLGGNLGIDTVAISATGSGGVNGGCYRVFIFGDGNYFQLDAEL